MVIISKHETESAAIDLDRAQCLDLLRSTSVGRVVLSIQCIPVAVAVGITMMGDELLPGPDPMFIKLRPTLLTGRRFEWNGNLLGGGEPGV